MKDTGVATAGKLLQLESIKAERTLGKPGSFCWCRLKADRLETTKEVIVIAFFMTGGWRILLRVKVRLFGS